MLHAVFVVVAYLNYSSILTTINPSPLQCWKFHLKACLKNRFSQKHPQVFSKQPRFLQTLVNLKILCLCYQNKIFTYVKTPVCKTFWTRIPFSHGNQIWLHLLFLYTFCKNSRATLNSVHTHCWQTSQQEWMQNSTLADKIQSAIKFSGVSRAWGGDRMCAIRY